MLVLLLASLLAQSSVPRAEARRLFEQGEAQFSAGTLLAAEQSFTQSYALLPLAATAWNLARCAEAAKTPAPAIGWYRRYLRLDPSAADRAQVEASMRRLEKQLEARGVQALTLFISPAGGSASVDGGAPLFDGATIELAAGVHRVMAAAPGAVSAQVDVTLSLAASQEASMTLSPTPVATDEHGFVELPARTPLPVPPDAPVVTPAPIFNPTFAPRVPVVQLPPAREHKLRFTWVAVGVTAAALISGVVFGAVATSTSAQLRDGRVRDQDAVNALKGTIDTTAPIATVSWIVAGAGAVGTAVAMGVEW